MNFLGTNFPCAIPYTAQKIKFFLKDFFSKYDHIHRKLRIWSHLQKKSLMGKTLFFCAVLLEMPISIQAMKLRFGRSKFVERTVQNLHTRIWFLKKRLKKLMKELLKFIYQRISPTQVSNSINPLMPGGNKKITHT